MHVVVFRGTRGALRRRAVASSGPADVGVVDDAPGLDARLPDIDWRAWPPDTERTRFDAPSGSLARVALGPADGPRVVLVPGATGSKEDFVLLMPLLAASGYRVESFDLAGQYESAGAGPWNLVPPRPAYDERLFVEDLLAVLDDGAGRAHVLGYSFAGTVAERALAERPDRFASLTLLSTPPLAGQVFRGMKRIGPITGVASPRQGAALMLWGIRNNLNRVPPRRLAFVRARFMDWPTDPWTKASYSFPAPGQVTSQGPTLRQGIGRLHFAGEYTSYGFMGFMEGALESGAAVARRIAARDGVAKEAAA